MKPFLVDLSNINFLQSLGLRGFSFEVFWRNEEISIAGLAGVSVDDILVFQVRNDVGDGLLNGFVFGLANNFWCVWRFIRSIDSCETFNDTVTGFFIETFDVSSLAFFE